MIISATLVFFVSFILYAAFEREKNLVNERNKIRKFLPKKYGNVVFF